MALLSLIPFFSPTIMPMRIALDAAPLGQVLLSVVLTCLLIAALVWFAGRVYSNAVLRMGSRVRLREALSAR
jgi:ABC-2 type transport system permease protein